MIRTLIRAARGGSWPVRDPRSLRAGMGIAGRRGPGTEGHGLPVRGATEPVLENLDFYP